MGICSAKAEVGRGTELVAEPIGIGENTYNNSGKDGCFARARKKAADYREGSESVSGDVHV